MGKLGVASAHAPQAEGNGFGADDGDVGEISSLVGHGVGGHGGQPTRVEEKDSIANGFADCRTGGVGHSCRR